MFISQDSGQITGPSRDGPRHFGHAHFWERAMMSRRKFIGAAAGTTGAILGAGLWVPKLALAAGVEELVLFHHRPERSDEEVDRWVAACRASLEERGGSGALRVTAAAEGMTLVV